jgi:hypothetical protein
MNIQTQKPKKNKFNLSREVKQTGNIGKLMPCFIQDVIPGDSFKVDTQQMIRFSPLVAPMMHNIDFKLDYFFVPYRLVWKEWKDFITGGEDGNDLPSYPRIGIHGNTKQFLTKGSLADYMGVPPVQSNTFQADGAWSDVSSGDDKQFISALPFRAYQLIYHEYFRDQNVGTEYDQHEFSGTYSLEGAEEILTMRNTNWEKDYFTSALPFLQRGGEVQLPLGQVTVDSFRTQQPLSVYSDANLNTDDLKVSRNGYFGLEEDSLFINDSLGNYPVELTGDMQAVTINELRKASALQQWLELMARAGSRYREQIFAIFGERIPDYTVQVPQYLGGGKTPIMVSEVLSTYSQSDTGDRPQGDMSGHALGLGDNIGFQQSFDEHGIVLGICRLVPKATYTQGLGKFWQKFDKFDHFFPQFANLGEQEVYKKELFVKGNSQDEEIFGYQQRYAEYKYCNNRIAGDFRDTLSHWELSRRFADAPLLNQSFVEIGDYETSRIFAVQEGDKIWMSFYHNVDALRPIPYYSNPQLS